MYLYHTEKRLGLWAARECFGGTLRQFGGSRWIAVPGRRALFRCAAGAIRGGPTRTPSSHAAWTGGRSTVDRARGIRCFATAVAGSCRGLGLCGRRVRRCRIAHCLHAARMCAVCVTTSNLVVRRNNVTPLRCRTTNNYRRPLGARPPTRQSYSVIEHRRRCLVKLYYSHPHTTNHLPLNNTNNIVTSLY